MQCDVVVRGYCCDGKQTGYSLRDKEERTMVEITKAELKKIAEFGDFLNGHGYTKAATDVYALVKKIEARAAKEMGAAS